MNFDNHSLIVSLIKSLEKAGVPTDDLHVHKTLFLLHEAIGDEIPFTFAYWNGPYSYDVEDEIARMRGYVALQLVPTPGGGTAFRLAHNAEVVVKKYPISRSLRQGINAISDFVKSVGIPPIELDRQATVAWIMRREGITDHELIINRFIDLKPLSPPEAIERAIGFIEEFFREAKTSGLSVKARRSEKASQKEQTKLQLVG